MKFFSGKGMSKGDGISVFSNSVLSIPPAFSGSSIASYKSIYLLKKMKAASF
jgi:hypothetical protein